MFFGFSQLSLDLYQEDKHIFIMNTDSTADPLSSPTINKNQNELLIEQLYIWQDTCVSSPSNAVPLIGYTCTVGCPNDEYMDTNQFCTSCGASGLNCLTCDATQCVSCDLAAPTYRVLDTALNPDACVCLTSYFELTNGTCMSCASYLTYCLDCTNETFCTSCSTGFTPENGVCVCSANTYLNNGTCIPLQGCLNYYTITNAYYCTNCDTSNYF